MLGMVLAVVALALVNFLYKAAGPASFGNRPFPPRIREVADALPIALLAALLVVNLFGPRWHELNWTTLPGLAVALMLRARHRSHLTCIVGGVVCTVALRGVLSAIG